MNRRAFAGAALACLSAPVAGACHRDSQRPTPKGAAATGVPGQGPSPGAADARTSADAGRRTEDGRVVIVEMFTSEGCSSCPPADELLADLERRQPVAGVEIVGMELHVDYWNYLGWRDPFSSAEASARQKRYAGRHGGARIFTPEAVVQGKWSTTGSDRARVVDRIRMAAETPRRSLGLTREASTVVAHVGARRPGEDQPASLYLAVIERGLATHVKAGENRGKVLHHASVVRHLERVAPATVGDHRWTVPDAAQADTEPGALSVVALTQVDRSLVIDGASRLAL